MIDKFSIFKDFKRVAAEDLTIMGAPVLECRSADDVLKDKIATLERQMKQLSTLQSHDALCLLKNSIAMPKLLYILRTSPCANNPLLHRFDMMLKNGLETILNVQLSDTHWKQSSLPVHMGGLGVRSTCMLALSALPASATAMLLLQKAILSASAAGADDTAVSNIKTTLCCLANTTESSDQSMHIQRAWDASVTTAAYNVLMPTSLSPMDLARFKAVVTAHAGDWLHASPLIAVGLRIAHPRIAHLSDVQFE